MLHEYSQIFSLFSPSEKKKWILAQAIICTSPPPLFFFSFTSYFTLNQAKSILLMEYLLWDVHF